MTPNEYQQFCLETAYIYRDRAFAMVNQNDSAVWKGARLSLQRMYVVGKLNGEAGELAEKVCKQFRDGDGRISRHDICRELGDVLWYCAALADEYNFTLEEVMQVNIDKLRARREKGTLQGSGDDR